MITQENKVVEVFGKFAVLLEKGVVMFDDIRDANEALAAFEGKELFSKRAKAYTDAKGIQGKNAVGKQNIIEDFLAWECVQNVETETEEDLELPDPEDSEEFEDSSVVDLLAC